MLVRILIFLLIAALIFVPLNWYAIRQLLRIHPRRKRWILGAAIVGNLMWPFFPLLNSFTDFSRTTRSILGPPWFTWVSFALLYVLFIVVLRVVWLVFARRRAFREFAHWPSRVFLGLLMAGFVVGCYQALVPLRVERVTLRVAGLAKPARVALMGDLHVGLFTRPRRLAQFFAMASDERPDALLIAGDLIDDDPFFVPKLLEGARSAPRLPIFAVFGNHEMYGRPETVREALRGSRIRLLVNEGAPLGGLWIAGVSDPAAVEVPWAKHLAPDLGKALAAKPAASIPLVLAHQPRIIDEARKRGMPVVLCAHTHGGQLGFRHLGISLAGLFLPYHMGLYDFRTTRMYINTGTGFWLVPFRLGMTPEITIVELRP